MPKLSGRFSILVVPLVTWLALLIPFVIYQQYYVRSQEAYLSEHGFRILSAVGRQLDSFVGSLSIAINTAKKPDTTPDKNQDKNPVNNFEHYLGHFLPKLIPLQSDLIIQFAPASIGDNRFLIEFGSGQSTFRRTFKDVPISGRLILDKALRNRLNFGEDYFDDILIAAPNGDVLLQQSLDTPITNLNHLLTSTALSTTDATTPQAGNNKPISSHDTASPAVHFEFSNVLPVKVAGDDYKLFVQPFRLTLDNSEVTDDGDGRLLLCGLWRTERLNSDSFALPYSSVIRFGLWFVIVGTFGWPFLKINYMSRTERLRRIDGWFLVLSMLLGAVAATVMVLNASYTTQSEANVDSDLDTLSAQIRNNVQRELSLALKQLARLSDEEHVERSAHKHWNPEINILDPEKHADTRFKDYPYYDIAFWADGNGQQLVKYSVDSRATPPTLVNDQKFFKDVMAAAKSVTPSLAVLDGQQYSLQTLVSPTTGQVSTVIASRYEKAHSKIKIQAMVFRPLSLVNPVLPPDFGFAVLERDGSVLFHSNPFRNLSENFLGECKEPAVMRSALFSRSPQKLDIVYSGRERRALVTELNDLGPEPVTLVVFHNTDVNRTVNLAIILVVTLLMGFNIIVIVVIAISDVLRGAPYPPEWIWPRRQSAVRYALVFLVNSLLVLAFFHWYSVWELSLLAFTCGILVTGIICTFGLLLMKKQPTIKSARWNATLHQGFKVHFVAAAVSLLVVATVVPCFGFFKFAYDAANELAAKHGQLTILNQLMERQKRITDYYQNVSAPTDIATHLLEPCDLQLLKTCDLDRYDGIKLVSLSFQKHDEQSE